MPIHPANPDEFGNLKSNLAYMKKQIPPPASLSLDTTE